MKNPAQYRTANALGKEFEDKVYAELRRFNPGISKPPKPEEWAEDDGDIRADVEIICKRRLKLDFTCREDFPFQTVYVNEQYKMRPAHMSKDEYCSLPMEEKLRLMKWFHSCWVSSADMTHIALVLPSTKRHWGLENVWSPEDNRYALTFSCPKDKVLFGRFEDMPSLLTWT